MSAWDDLKERKLVQWALGYTAFGIAVLEILNAAETPFGLSNGLVRACMVGVGVGFVLTLVLAWFHGERGHQRVSLAELGLLLAIGGIGTLGIMLAARSRADERTVLRASPPTAVQGRRSPRRARERNSLAVLPFRNLSGNAQDEYFSDGVTEELTNALGSLPGLRVASPTSAFQFKSSRADLRDIGSQLGVATVLEGSVQRSGGRLRITARLVDATSGYQLWQQRIDADAADIFAAEDSISRGIARALRLQLALTRRPTENARPTDPVAHQSYLKGRYYARQSDPDSLRLAQRQFREAARRDPTFAPALAGLAQSFVALERLGAMPAGAARDSARRWAERAMRLDPMLPQVHVVLARTAEDLATRQRELQRALQLNPNDAEARRALAEVMLVAGKLDSARAQTRQLEALDRSARGRAASRRIEFMLGADGHPPTADLRAPVGNGPASLPGGGSLHGVPTAARIHAELCLEWSTDPTLVRLGNALRECERARLAGANDPGVLTNAALGFARLGRRHAALDAVGAAQRLTPGPTVSDLAAVQLALGDRDSAFAILARERPALIRAALKDARLAPLRSDARFTELLRRARP